MQYMSYEEFSKLIPKSTKTYIDEVLKHKLNSNDDLLLAALKVALLEEKTVIFPIIKKYFNRTIFDHMKCMNTNVNENIINNFSYSADILCDFNKEKFYLLTPSEIILKLLNKVDAYYFFEESTKCSSSSIINKINNCKNEMKSLIELERENVINEIIEEILKNLDLETIIYLKKSYANYINNELSKQNTKLSFCYTFLFTYMKIYKIKKINYLNYLTEIEIQNINRKLERLTDYQNSIQCINQEKFALFLKKMHEQIFNCENVDSKEITIKKLVELSLKQIILGNFKNIENYNKKFDLLDFDKIFNYKEKYDTELLKKEIDYIKILYILYKKIEENNRYSMDELISISIFLSTFYTENDVKLWFGHENINLNDCLEFLNTKILKEELLANVELENIDSELLEKLVSKIKSNGDINSIIMNEISKNEIPIKKIFLNFNIRITDNFKNNINTKIKEIQEKNNIQKEYNFFKGLNKEVIDFIIFSNRKYDSCIKMFKHYDYEEIKDDLVKLSLLYGLNKSEINQDTKIIKFISKKINTTVSPTNKHNIDFIIDNYSKYIFDGYNKNKERSKIKILDIIKNLSFEEFKNKDGIYEQLLTEKNIPYSMFINIEKEYEQYLMDSEKNFKNDKSEYTINCIEILHKIYNIKHYYYDNNSLLVISMFYIDNKYKKILEKNGLKKEDIFEFYKYPDVGEILKIKIIDYSDIEDKIIKTGLNYEKKLKFKILEMFKSETFNKYLEEKIGTSKLKEMIKEIETGIPNLTDDEQLERFSNCEISNINTNNIDEILSFASELSDQVEIIADEYIKAIYFNQENEIGTIKGVVNSLTNQKEKRKFKLFRNNKINDDENIKLQTKEEKFEIVKNYLIKEERELVENLKNLQFIRKMIAIYIANAQKYLETLEEANNNLKIEIQNKVYIDNDFRIYDDELRQQLLTDKIVNINSSIIQMIQQYQKVTLQMSTHASIINQINLARNTTLQNLQIEMTLNEGIRKEKESINSLNGLVNLLENMTISNSRGIVENIDEIRKISLKNSNIKITDEDKVLINRILEEQEIEQLSIGVNEKQKKLIK